MQKRLAVARECERTVIVENVGNDDWSHIDFAADGSQVDQEHFSQLNLIITKDGNKRGAKFIDSWRKREQL